MTYRAKARRTPATALPAWVRLVRDREAWEARLGGQVVRVRGPEDALRAVEFLRDEEVEVFVVVMLNTRGKVLGVQEVTRGLLDASLVHPREVFRAAIAMGAAAVIIAHNHPSNDPTPSAEDRAVTRQLVAAGQLLDVPVYDHLVVTATGYTAFSTAGLM